MIWSSIDYFIILFRREQVLWLRLVGNLQQPCVFSILVDQRRVLLNLVVDFQNFTSNRSIHISCNFHTLYHHRTLIFLERFTNSWKFDVYNLAKLLLSVIGYADFRCFCLRVKINPLMAFGVFLCCVKWGVLANNLRIENKGLICYLLILIRMIFNINLSGNNSF